MLTSLWYTFFISLYNSCLNLGTKICFFWPSLVCRINVYIYLEENSHHHDLIWQYIRLSRSTYAIINFHDFFPSTQSMNFSPKFKHSTFKLWQYCRSSLIIIKISFVYELLLLPLCKVLSLSTVHSTSATTYLMICENGKVVV